MCSVSRSSHFPVRVIRNAMHEWMDSIILHDDNNNNNNKHRQLRPWDITKERRASNQSK